MPAVTRLGLVSSVSVLCGKGFYICAYFSVYSALIRVKFVFVVCVSMYDIAAYSLTCTVVFAF